MIQLLFGLAFGGFIGTLICLWQGVLAHSDPECRAIFPVAAISTAVFLSAAIILRYVRSRFDQIEERLTHIMPTRDE